MWKSLSTTIDVKDLIGPGLRLILLQMSSWCVMKHFLMICGMAKKNHSSTAVHIVLILLRSF